MMTVRFKATTEYQRSFRFSRSRSASPQRCAPLAGLRSDQMGITREPPILSRRKPSLVRPLQMSSSLLWPSEPDPVNTRPTDPPTRPPAPPPGLGQSSCDPVEPACAGTGSQLKGSRPSSSCHPAERELNPEREASPLALRPHTPPDQSAHSGSPRPAAVATPSPHPSESNIQPQTRTPLTALDRQQPVANGVQRALRWKAGLRSGGQRSEYHRQFNWKTTKATESPLLNAQQVFYSSSKSVPPFKKNPVPMETEYRRSFRASDPPTGLRKHLEQHRVPLFHHDKSKRRKRREEPERKSRPQQEQEVRSQSLQKAPPPQANGGHRKVNIEDGCSFSSPVVFRFQEAAQLRDAPAGHQVKELRERALFYRNRAWGIHFSRQHLNQLLSEHNCLWEPSDSNTDRTSNTATDTNTDTPTDHCSPCVTPDPAGDPAGDPELEESSSSRSLSIKTLDLHREEGRLPTPTLKTHPVQRTHHDRTTPATGGALLVSHPRLAGVGGPRRSQAPPGKPHSPSRQTPAGVAMAAGVGIAEPLPLRLEAWSDSSPAPSHIPDPASSPAKDTKPALTPSPKPARVKRTQAPPPASPHCIQGTLRHAEFQHNGNMGVRLSELQCQVGGCGTDDDDRLSVMSWRSASSCSMASAVLERAQKRRDNFWGKR